MFNYPFILQKNSLMNIKKIHESFITFIKYIYSCELMEQLFYITPEFKDFLYPLKDKNILEELFENTWFLPFNNNNNLYGYTEKLIAKILIPANIDAKNNLCIELLINFFANLLITILNEQFKNYVKTLIFYNEESELYLNIIKYTEKYNFAQTSEIIIQKEIDDGHLLEILLFGNIINEIYITASFDIFSYSSWKADLKTHLLRFIKLNSSTKSNELAKQKTIINNLNMKELENNKDIPEFILLLLKEYAKVKNIKDNVIKINANYKSSRRRNNIIYNPEFKIDSNHYDVFSHEKIDCRW